MNKALLVLLMFGGSCYSQSIGLKTNVLHLSTSSLNVGLEIKTSEQTTLSLVNGYNPWQFPTYRNSKNIKVNPKISHYVLMPEYKYWFCKAFEQSYIGLHGIYGQYNIEGFPFVEEMKNHQYKGFAYGGGLSFGYQWALGTRWGFELSLGAGYVRAEYDKYECDDCSEKIGTFGRDYVGPTKASVSFVYYLE